MSTLTKTTKQMMFDRLRSRLAENPDLRETFFTQPKTVLAEELGWQVPEEIELKVVKATATQHYVTLPCQIEGAQMDANSTADSEFEDAVVRRALGDPDFKHRLLTQPKATLEEILHFRLPAAVTITVLEETPQTWYVVCPLLPDMVADELDDRALEAVAGGASSSMNDSGGNHAQLPCETEPRSSFARSQEFKRPRFQRPRFPICH